MDDKLQLLDWKRRVFELYASVRRFDDVERAWDLWRRGRDELFRRHPQSPLPDHARASSFARLEYFDYQATWRVNARVHPVEEAAAALEWSTGGGHGFTRAGRAEFHIGDRSLGLDLFWVTGYGGGLFVPFRDTTSGTSTYGGGRYLLDTVKGADLGTTTEGLLVFDFNFAYNPSCSYDPRWQCPLTPPGNHLPVAVTAGEKAPAVTHA